MQERNLQNDLQNDLQERADQFSFVTHPSNVGRRLAWIVADRNPRDLTKRQRKWLGRQIGKQIRENSGENWMKFAASIYLEYVIKFDNSG